MEAISGIYQIKNKANGKFYIGSSFHIAARIRKHRSELGLNRHHSRHLQYSWNKYGADGFEFVILELVPRTDNIMREQYYLDTLKPVYNNSPTAASNLGVKRTDEQKKRYSECKKGDKAPWFGKKLSPTHCARIGDAARGRKYAYKAQPNKNKPVVQMTLDGGFVANHASVTEAASSVSRTIGALSSHLAGKTKFCAGFTWKFN